MLMFKFERNKECNEKTGRNKPKLYHYLHQIGRIKATLSYFSQCLHYFFLQRNIISASNGFFSNFLFYFYFIFS